MKIVKIYFGHGRTNLVSVGGIGPRLPEMTSMILEVDESANPAEAPALRESYLLEDMFGQIIHGCYWCRNLKALGEFLTYTLWREGGRKPAATISVTRIIHSDIIFVASGELGRTQPATAA